MFFWKHEAHAGLCLAHAGVCLAYARLDLVYAGLCLAHAGLFFDPCRGVFDSSRAGFFSFFFFSGHDSPGGDIMMIPRHGLAKEIRKTAAVDLISIV